MMRLCSLFAACFTFFNLQVLFGFPFIPLEKSPSFSVGESNDKFSPFVRNPLLHHEVDEEEGDTLNVPSPFDRRVFIGAALTAIASSSVLPFSAEAEEENGVVKDGQRQVQIVTTKSGLKYYDVREGLGPRVKYGQLVSFAYKGFVKVGAGEDRKPEMFDQDKAYLTKHGNGRMIPGLDEGIHTMNVGGRRRIIIPPKLGYFTSGLGPLPEGPIARYKLNKLLDEMVDARTGQIIFDVEILSAIDDEADQGYYEDLSLPPEDFNTLRINLQKSALEARDAGNMGSSDQI